MATRLAKRVMECPDGVFFAFGVVIVYVVVRSMWRVLRGKEVWSDG